jgi:hypothetical protein
MLNILKRFYIFMYVYIVYMMGTRGMPRQTYHTPRYATGS